MKEKKYMPNFKRDNVAMIVYSIGLAIAVFGILFDKSKVIHIFCYVYGILCLLGLFILLLCSGSVRRQSAPPLIITNKAIIFIDPRDNTQNVLEKKEIKRVFVAKQLNTLSVRILLKDPIKRIKQDLSKHPIQRPNYILRLVEYLYLKNKIGITLKEAFSTDKETRIKYLIKQLPILEQKLGYHRSLALRYYENSDELVSDLSKLNTSKEEMLKCNETMLEYKKKYDKTKEKHLRINKYLRYKLYAVMLILVSIASYFDVRRYNPHAGLLGTIHGIIVSIALIIFIELLRLIVIGIAMLVKKKND